ncbi:MAG: hypothetical protein HOH77_19260 [Candidatus Latescibacteria bacterium]|nr:hypothetical protein [Candidatus Latescibacterota bacterium]
MYKRIFLVLCCIWGITSISAQEPGQLAPPHKHEKRFYTNPKGTLFVARNLPVYLSLSPSIKAGSDTHLLKSDAEYTHPMFLVEGLNRIGNTKAVDPKTKKPVPGTGAYFEVYGDGIPPKTTRTFSQAHQHEDKNTIFFGKVLDYALSSQDALSGVQKIYISINGAEFEPFQKNVTHFPRESYYHVRYYAVDQVGNIEEPHDDEFWIDMTAPYTTFSIQGTYALNNWSSDVEISLASSDSLSGVKAIYYQFDLGEKHPYTEPVKVRDLEEGEHVFYFFAEDHVDNVETAQTYTFFHDSTPPQIETSIIGNHHQLDNTIYVSGNAQIKMEATDNLSGVSSIQYAMNNGEQKTYKAPFFLPPKSGLHDVFYHLTDKVGNVSKKRTQKVYVDLTAPKTSFDFSDSFFKELETFVITPNGAITLRSVDLESGIREIKYSLNDGPPEIYTAPIRFETLGKFRLTFYAEDHVSNVEEQHVLDIRVEPATNKITTPEGMLPSSTKAWFNKNGQLIGPTGLPFYLYISASPESTAETFLLDLGSSTSQDSTGLYFSQKGENHIQLHTSAGQVAVKVDIDGVPPITQPQFLGAQKSIQNATTYYGSNLRIALLAQDSDKGAQAGLKQTFLAIDGSDFILYQAPLQNFSREKPYTLHYYSTDQVGNVESVKEEYFTVDTTMPKTWHTIEGEFYGHFLSPKTAISLSASDNLSGIASIYYAFDDGEAQPYRGKLTGKTLNALSDGRHTLHYFARDNVGNTEDAQTFVFHLDKVPPAVSINIEGNTFKQRDTLFVPADSRILLKADDISLEAKSILYQIDGGTPKTFSSSFDLPQNQGMHSVTYYSTDIVGNVSEKKTQMVYLDLTPPKTQWALEGMQIHENNTLFINAKTSVLFSTTDQGSGVKHIGYKIDNGTLKTYSHPLSLTQHGIHTITYYATDQVKNTESNKTLTVFVDKTAPQINLTYNVESKMSIDKKIRVIPQTALIYIQAEETDTAIDKITYSINGGRVQLYRKPLSNFKKGETLKIKIMATDRLENLSKKEISLWVE